MIKKRGTIVAICILVGLLIFGWTSSMIFIEDGGLFGYSDTTLSIGDRGLSPFDNQSHLESRHILGTDKLGRDTLAGIGSGISIAFFLSLYSVVVSLIIGLFMSFLSTFHLFTQVKVSSLIYWVSVIGIWYVMYLITSLVYTTKFNFTYQTIAILFLSIGIYLASRKRNWRLTLDEMVLKIIELWRTLPAIMILLIIASLVDNITYPALGVLIAILIWPSITRLLRGEFIRLSGLPYIKSAQASGVSLWTLYWKHLIPNALAPLIAHICFAMVAIILLEATLSFLGIGVPYDQISLGGMIKASTDNLQYWWLAVFPGLTLVTILISLNKIGTSFLEKED